MQILPLEIHPITKFVILIEFISWLVFIVINIILYAIGKPTGIFGSILYLITGSFFTMLSRLLPVENDRSQKKI